MIKNSLKLGQVLILVVLMGCASANRKAHRELKKSIVKGDLEAAIVLAKSKNFYPEVRNKLIKWLELATLYHIRGDYFQSLTLFDKAKDLSDKLFTVSMSKKVLSAVANNNQDNYYGEIYERSLIRFYIVLNHYMLYQKGTYEAHTLSKVVEGAGKKAIKTKQVEEKKLTPLERKNHLSAARASLLEWDSLLSNYSTTMKGETTYKHDLSSRLFGAFIHEQMGTRTDNEIALNLYREAKKILFRNYNLYDTYNKKFKEFSKNYKDLPKMRKKVVEKKYVQKTTYAKNLLKYIDLRIKEIKTNKKTNVTFLIQQGHVAEKKARRIDFPLPMGSLPKGKGVAGFVGVLLNTTRGTIPTISFELPEVEKRPTSKKIAIIIKDKNGKLVKEVNSVVVNPISNIAFQTLDNKILGTYTKIGARVAGKHIAAIAAAYASYKTAAKSLGDMGGQMVASSAYAISNKAIANSEVADLRFWSTLPHTLRMAKVQLAPGEYSLFFKVSGSKKLIEQKHLNFKVNSKKRSLININQL